MYNLYHGSADLFKYINITAGIKTPDFGVGFYLASSKQTAIKRARLQRKRKMEAYNLNNDSEEIKKYLYTYQYDNELAERMGLYIKNFKTVDMEWLLFVMHNRIVCTGHNYDIVIGGTADAKAMSIIKNYSSEYISGTMTNELAQIIIKRLKTEVYSRQYCFHTQRSIQCLRLIDVKEIK